MIVHGMPNHISLNTSVPQNIVWETQVYVLDIHVVYLFHINHECRDVGGNRFNGLDARVDVMKYSNFCTIGRNKAANMSKVCNESHLFRDTEKMKVSRAVTILQKYVNH